MGEPLSPPGPCPPGSDAAQRQQIGRLDGQRADSGVVGGTYYLASDRFDSRARHGPGLSASSSGTNFLQHFWTCEMEVWDLREPETKTLKTTAAPAT